MRVAFDASSIGSGLGGDETMARALVRALVRGAGPDDEIDLLFAAKKEKIKKQTRKKKKS